MNVYELETEQVEKLARIKELEGLASSDVDLRELKRERKRYYELEDALLVARNKERLANKEVSIGYIREAESKNQENYTRMIQVASECLPKLRDISSQLQEISLCQGKMVTSGQEATQLAIQIMKESGESIPVNVKLLVVLTRINPIAIGSYIEKLELLLKDNDNEHKQDT